MKKTRLLLSSFLVLSFFINPLPSFSESITFRADSMTGSASQDSGKTSLEGNASVITDTMEITAELIEISGDSYSTISAIGSVVGTNKESLLNFTCGKMTFDRNTKIARLEDGVHLIDTKNDVTADAEIIEFNQDTGVAVMEISVNIKQKDNTCTSSYAVYRQNEQQLEMSGNPKVIQGSDTFRAQEINLNLNTQEITLNGRVRGSVTTGD